MTRLSSDVRFRIRRRAEYACEYCGVREQDVGGELTVDHYQPQSLGGSDELDPALVKHRQQRREQVQRLQRLSQYEQATLLHARVIEQLTQQLEEQQEILKEQARLLAILLEERN